MPKMFLFPFWSLFWVLATGSNTRITKHNSVNIRFYNKHGNKILLCKYRYKDDFLWNLIYEIHSYQRRDTRNNANVKFSYNWAIPNIKQRLSLVSRIHESTKGRQHYRCCSVHLHRKLGAMSRTVHTRRSWLACSSSNRDGTSLPVSSISIHKPKTIILDAACCSYLTLPYYVVMLHEKQELFAEVCKFGGEATHIYVRHFCDWM